MLGTHPLVRFLNQNRRQIIVTIIAIVGVLLVLRLLNSLAEKKIENQIVQTNTYYTELSISNKNKELIQNFLEYCKEGDESGAYALLSSECKENYFNNINVFKSDYINKYFNVDKVFIIDDNKNSNYIVTIKDNILSAGTTQVNFVNQSFIIVKEDGIDKITIDKF